ncbi:MAG: hypothetical protein ACOC7J_05995, partial [Armatimonadota bacterium]
PSGRTPAKSALLLFAGLIGGAVIGILAVLLLHYIDATFKNAYEARRLSGRRVLGAIPRTDIIMAPEEPAEEPEPAGGAEADMGPAEDDAKIGHDEEAEG